MANGYPLQELSDDGTVVSIQGRFIDPAKLAQQLLPIRDSIAKVIEQDPKFPLQSIEVALSISAEGDIAFLRAGVGASLTLTFERK